MGIGALHGFLDGSLSRRGNIMEASYVRSLETFLPGKDEEYKQDI
jgi:hypothetical protein